MGSTVVNDASKMAAFVEKAWKKIGKTGDKEEVKKIAKAFLEVGKKYGVPGDIAFCQSIIETHYFLYDLGTAVTPDQHNY
jgi:hypothetical protein